MRGSVSILRTTLGATSSTPVSTTPSTDPQAATQQPGSEKASTPRQTPEEIAALKAQREKAIKWNAIVTQTATDMQARNWQPAAAGFRQLIELDPSQYEPYAG